MIKNKSQLANTQQLLREARVEINEVGTQYSGTEKEILLIPLERERERLVSEIDEYNELLDKSIDELMTTILSKPVLLGNIGPLLTKLRMASDLTQSELAERIGWEQANLSRFEGENYSSQTVGKIVQYAGALGVYLHLTPSLSEYPAERVETDQEVANRLLRVLMGEGEPELVQFPFTRHANFTTYYSDEDPIGEVEQSMFEHSNLLILASEAIESST